MFRYIVASAAVMALAAGATAQTQQMAGRTHQSVAPTHGTYNMTTGFEVSTQAYRTGPEVIFDNTAGAEYYFSTLVDTEEWIDEMAFVARDVDGDEQINGIDWEYCSLLADGAGTAITTELRFYNDTILGAGPTGWLDLGAGTNQNAQCGYLIAGLPGDTSGTGISCWIVAVDLEGGGLECSLPQELTPGGFTEFNGIGWMYRDAQASGSTGPVLDSLVGTSTVGYGAQDYFELFDISLGLGAEYVGAFWFGGGAKLQGSFQTVLYGNGLLDTDVVNADAPLALDNTLTLRSDNTPTSGVSTTWSCDEAATAGLGYNLIGSFGSSSAGFGTLLGPDVTLLVNPGALVGPLAPAAMSTGGGTASFTTPLMPAAVDTLTLNLQAFGMSGGPGTATEASNALRHSN